MALSQTYMLVRTSTQPLVKRAGRPKGSKNKPKAAAAAPLLAVVDIPAHIAKLADLKALGTATLRCVVGSARVHEPYLWLN